VPSKLAETVVVGSSSLVDVRSVDEEWEVVDRSSRKLVLE
jgi:hypothetical protein